MRMSKKNSDFALILFQCRHGKVHFVSLVLLTQMWIFFKVLFT